MSKPIPSNQAIPGTKGNDIVHGNGHADSINGHTDGGTDLPPYDGFADFPHFPWNVLSDSHTTEAYFVLTLVGVHPPSLTADVFV
jgi:hypothetical protein